MRPIVVIPVFNAADELRQCFEALLTTLTAADTVVIADDASTDPAVTEVIATFKDRTSAHTNVSRNPRNLGFVANVNRVFDAYPGSDVVLLNSDTLVTTGWLEQIAQTAASDPRIATVTPWSNNAEICSYPHMCVNNPLLSQTEREAIATAALSLKTEFPPQLPTGVGFAMFVRAAAVAEIGAFDQATFGRGYGEENDFCQRAAAHGWKNVLCPTAYVEHVGSASFASTGVKPGGDNLIRLLARYPSYLQQVTDFIRTDPLKPLRERLTLALAH